MVLLFLPSLLLLVLLLLLLHSPTVAVCETSSLSWSRPSPTTPRHHHSNNNHGDNVAFLYPRQRRHQDRRTRTATTRWDRIASTTSSSSSSQRQAVQEVRSDRNGNLLRLRPVRAVRRHRAASCSSSTQMQHHRGREREDDSDHRDEHAVENADPISSIPKQKHEQNGSNVRRIQQPHDEEETASNNDATYKQQEPTPTTTTRQQHGRLRLPLVRRLRTKWKDNQNRLRTWYGARRRTAVRTATIRSNAKRSNKIIPIQRKKRRYAQRIWERFLAATAVRTSRRTDRNSSGMISQVAAPPPAFTTTTPSTTTTTTTTDTAESAQTATRTVAYDTTNVASGGNNFGNKTADADDAAAAATAATTTTTPRSSSTKISLPHWLVLDANETANLQAMKSILESDRDHDHGGAGGGIFVRARNRRIGSVGDGASPALAGREIAAVAFPDVYGDVRLLRFLRKDRPQDPRAAAARYRAFVRWRIDGRVDETVRVRILREQQDETSSTTTGAAAHPFDRDRPERVDEDGQASSLPSRSPSSHPYGSLFNNPPHPIVAQYMPYDFHVLQSSSSSSSAGLSQESNVTTCNQHIPFILHVGDWDTSTMGRMIQSSGTTANGLSLEGFLQHWIYLFETLHYQLYAESMRQERFVYADEIIDLSSTASPASPSSGPSRREGHATKGLLKQLLQPGFVASIVKPWIHVMQTYYPETTHTIYIVNPPPFVSLAWRILSPFISPNTLNKVQFVSLAASDSDPSGHPNGPNTTQALQARKQKLLKRLGYE